MGEAKRRKETGAPPPPKAKSNKPLYAGIGLLVLAAVLLGVFFLTAAPEPTSDELPVAAPNAEEQLLRLGAAAEAALREA